LEQALRLIAQWPRWKTNEYAELVVEVFLNYPVEVISRCADPIRGIGATRPNGEPRQHPPSTGEIKHYCDHVILDNSSKPLITAVPVRPEPTEEEKAYVAARAKEVIASFARAAGRKSETEKLTEAQRVLERCELERAKAALDAVKARQSPPTDGAHAARAFANLETRRRSPFDDPDM
jgi:hypothetical protein